MPALAPAAAPRLSPGYTSRRPIGAMSATVQATIHPAEIIWATREWAHFTGGPEDCDYNVIMERTTPITQTRIWVCDRDGPDSRPILILPEDY